MAFLGINLNLILFLLLGYVVPKIINSHWPLPLIIISSVVYIACTTYSVIFIHKVTCTPYGKKLLKKIKTRLE
jgi:NhaP-type Na+/H+ or K+/H+ antiporter